MSAPVDRDPPRWRDGQPPAEGGGAGAGAGAGEVERAIGAASRSVADAPGPDELRLAQVRQRALHHAARVREATMKEGRVAAFFGRDGGSWSWSRWARLAAVVLASLLVGGVATAVTGRLIQRYGSTRTTAAPAATRADDHAGKRSERSRRWRVSVQAPTNLELAVGPDGAEIAVVEGEAKMSGEGITDSVAVVPGRSWKEGAASVPAASALPNVAAAPPVRTLARNEASSAKAHGRASRAALSTDREGDRASSERIAEPPVQSPFEPPPLSSLALPPARVPPAKRVPSRIWGGSDLEPPAVPSVAAAPAPSAPTPTVGEATLVARALGRLRRDHDPLWALHDLEEHARVFPRGSLRHEARLARAEALLALDRRAEALAVLDGVRLGGAETERTAALARAELRAQEGRYGEAIADFDRVLAGSTTDASSERALFGRGLCRLRGGDLGGARADLKAHLERFPTSNRRAEIEKLLGRIER